MESAYVSVKDRKIINRGFLKGPFLPLYGSGALMMLIVSMPFRENIILTYLSGCVGATLLEYVTGVAMEKIFKVRYWDYSRLKFNFQGHVCLGTTLSWGFLTVFMTKFLHRTVEAFVLGFSSDQVLVFVCSLSVIFVSDFIISVRAAIDLRNILARMEIAKQELFGIQKRLSEMIAYAGNVTNGIAEGIANRTSVLAESVTEKKEEFAESVNLRLDDLKQSIEDKLQTVKEYAKNKPETYWEGVKSEFHDLKEKYNQSIEALKPRNSIKGLIITRVIRSNPGMTSEKFKASFEELKSKIVSGKKSEK